MREADRRAAAEDWEGVLALAAACRHVTEETGTQLWGPAHYADYRVALDAPAELAASVVVPGIVRPGLGPLTEVVAQHHGFAELAPHLDATVAAVVAQERVLRGEDLRAAPGLEPDPLAPPLVLAPFEPRYALPTYRAAERLDGDPTLTDVPDGAVEVAPRPADDAARAAAPVAARRTASALVLAVEEWTARSDGQVVVTSLAGEAADAVGAVVAVEGAVARMHPLDVPGLLGLVAAAGASGGVHGRRRGGAAGRSSAFWVAANATGIDDAPALDVDELEYRLEDLVLVRFDVPDRPRAAWRLGVALADPDAGWAVAIEARDGADPTDPEDEEHARGGG